MEYVIRIIADGLIIPIVILAAYALLFRVSARDRWRIYARILVAGMTTYLLAKLLGSVYQPALERPFELLGTSAGALYLDNPGFPSDHALFTAFLTLTVWSTTGQKKLAITLGVMTLLVCVGRVVALVHTPLDVIGGVAMALIGSLWYLQDSTLPVLRKKRKSQV
jgi:membrane-associated phospholipid phosphatase